MKAGLVLIALAAIADAKPKPFAATLACTAIDDAAQRTKLDGKKRTPRPKVVHKIECAVASTDSRIMEAKAVGRASWTGGHIGVEGKLVGDVQVKNDIRRLLMIEFETDHWDRCQNIDLDLALKAGDGGALWQQTVKTAGNCAPK
jgi:hypothetical protein